MPKEYFRLLKKNKQTFFYRPLYNVNWQKISAEEVQRAFEKHFPGQAFDLQKAAFAIDKEKQISM